MINHATGFSLEILSVYQFLRPPGLRREAQKHFLVAKNCTAWPLLTWSCNLSCLNCQRSTEVRLTGKVSTSMSLEFNDEETDRLLAAADEHLVDVIDESQPARSPEILGAVIRTLTKIASAGTAGMAPPDGSGGVLWEGESQCQGPSPVVSSHVP